MAENKSTLLAWVGGITALIAAITALMTTIDAKSSKQREVALDAAERYFSAANETRLAEGKVKMRDLEEAVARVTIHGTDSHGRDFRFCLKILQAHKAAILDAAEKQTSLGREPTKQEQKELERVAERYVEPVAKCMAGMTKIKNQ